MELEQAVQDMVADQKAFLQSSASCGVASPEGDAQDHEHRSCRCYGALCFVVGV